MDVKCSQLMRCIICYANLILISNAKTQARKGLILYNSANGIIALKKCLCCMIIKIFKEINNKKNLIRNNLQRKYFM
jgi:hypothetical protein